MKILIVTHDLTADNRHLMPWRTVCEIAEQLEVAGCRAEIVSLGAQKRELWPFVREIRKVKSFLAADWAAITSRLAPEVIFWPLSWRESAARLKMVKKTGVPVVGYFPGGYYPFSVAMYAARRIGVAKVFPYLLESVYEKIRGADFFRQNGVRNVITMSRLHGKMARAAGWFENEVFYIPPGKDDNTYSLSNFDGSLPEDFTAWLGDRRYFLFMGPPSAIRGVFELLEAFETAAGKRDDICLVCLFRNDAALDSVRIRKKIASLKYSGRVYVIWQSVGKDQLQAFMKNCHAVLLPFVLVPSEIPLAIIESMSWGKPVVATVPSGTGEFVRRFGAVAKLGDIQGLASVMSRLVDDDRYYQERCQLTLKEYANHPDWHEVALKWLHVGEAAVSGKVVDR